MSKKPPASKDYEELGRMLVNIYETGYVGRKQLYKMSFIKGILSGLGSVIGVTIVLGLIVWILSLFANISLIKPFVDPIRNSVQTKDK